MRHAIGFDGWCWMLTDPGSRLPTRDLGEKVIVDQAIRRFGQRHPEAWDSPWDRSAGQPVTVTSVVAGGDLAQDRAWRETFGPAGIGDHLSAPLIADGTCWAQLHIHRDSRPRGWHPCSPPVSATGCGVLPSTTTPRPEIIPRPSPGRSS